MTSVGNAPGGQANAKCPSCGEAVKSAWKVCPACETPLGRLACRACGIPVKDNWKICPECNTRLICQACGYRLPGGLSECPKCGQDQEAAPESQAIQIEPVTGIELVLVPAGTFLMGDLFNVGWDNEVPVQEMRIDAFYLGKFTVTQEQWEKVMAENLSRFRKGGRYPVEQVTWADANEFIRRLNGLTSGGKPFRLPLEAEWEYAARSGGKDEQWAGTVHMLEADEYVWSVNNSNRKPQPVAGKRPNGLGLYDMSGNVWEWCSDWMGKYDDDPAVNPQGPRSGKQKVWRSGCYAAGLPHARCVRRAGSAPEQRYIWLGFRVAKGTIEKAGR